ncbi:LysR family transcriptional regulator [Kordiimonas sp.]|uniref:LysR family transcriptional regulator n=1 Tax=Kordiimonas sp. TaxID=1970157 RepID=UPI003A8D3584
MDKLTAITTFRHVAELGSFAAAARRMALSPAAISKNIRALEEHLGAQLINRTTRRMSLTEAGTAYHKSVVRVLDRLAVADQSVSEMKARPSGHLRVSAPLTFSLTQLTDRIPEFLAAYPDVTLDLSLEDRIVNIVEEGYDVAIRASARLEDSSLMAKKLMSMHHVVCAAPAYLAKHGTPESPTDLGGHEMVAFSLSTHSAEWPFTRGREAVRVPVQGRYKVSSSIAIKHALTGGFGIGIIPEIYVRDELKTGTLTRLLTDWQGPEHPVYAIYPERRFETAKLRAFLDWLGDVLREG